MTALQLLTWIASVASGGLVTALEWLKENVPDAADQIDDILFKIRDGLAPEHVAEAVLALPKEVLDTIKLQFGPHDNPSDSA